MKVCYRVKTHEHFQEVIENNQKVSNQGYIVYYKRNEIDHDRFGITASKKLGNAVKRNKIRRQVRMMCQSITKHTDCDENNNDYVIIVRREYLNREYEKNLEELKMALSKIRRKKFNEKNI